MGRTNKWKLALERAEREAVQQLPNGSGTYWQCASCFHVADTLAGLIHAENCVFQPLHLEGDDGNTD